MEQVQKITLDVNDLVAMLGISKGTIYTMCREQQVPHFKVRGRILFNREIIEAWTKGEYEHEAEHALG